MFSVEKLVLNALGFLLTFFRLVLGSADKFLVSLQTQLPSV